MRAGARMPGDIRDHIKALVEETDRERLRLDAGPLRALEIILGRALVVGLCVGLAVVYFFPAVTSVELPGAGGLDPKKLSLSQIVTAMVVATALWILLVTIVTLVRRIETQGRNEDNSSAIQLILSEHLTPLALPYIR